MENPDRKIKHGGVRLTDDEKKVIEKIAINAGLKWVSFAKRGGFAKKGRKQEHIYPFDRFIDDEKKKYLSVREGLKRIENEITYYDTECLDDHEREIYSTLFERSGLKSMYVSPKYRGIFRNKGLFRRAVRWGAMDELADSFTNEEAKRLWESEGYPEGTDEYGGTNKSLMESFREGDKLNLTEEEFDRISEVFRKCINM